MRQTLDEGKFVFRNVYASRMSQEKMRCSNFCNLPLQTQQIQGASMAIT